VVLPTSRGVLTRAPRSAAPPLPPLSEIPRSRARGSGVPQPAAPVDDATGRLEGLRRPDVGTRRPGVPLPAPPAAAEAIADEPITAEPIADEPAPETATDGTDEGAGPPARRRLSAPPRRRGLLWLLALVAGGTLAAVPTFTGLGATDPSAGVADYALGNDVDVSGDMGDADVRASITEAEAQVRLGELAASRATREPKTVLPAQGTMSTCFCMRWGTFHYGIDLAAPLGTPIYAAVDGVVLRAGPATGFGNAVYIEDTDGNTEVYGHMKYYSVKAGQVVHAGDLIAKVGSEGESTGPHLHFQIDKGSEYGKPINPLPWLQARGVQVPGA